MPWFCFVEYMKCSISLNFILNYLRPLVISSPKCVEINVSLRSLPIAVTVSDIIDESL
jgi:hypothetical protein